MENLKADGRDVSLDRLRGFAMMWVIFVHVLYWGGGGVLSAYPYSIIRSFCLFEMPLFFFVAGAGNSMGRKKSYRSFVTKRFSRILIPYWVYSFFCILLTLIHYFYKKELTGLLILKVIVSWIIPIGKQMTALPYLTWALWFVPVYLGIMLFFPALKRLQQTKYRYAGFLLLFLLYLLTFIVKNNIIQEIAFYSIWTYAGMFYSEIKEKGRDWKGRIGYWIAALFSFFGMIGLWLMGDHLDMQGNKFPPNLIFFFFSCTVMLSIMGLLPVINSVLEKISNQKIFRKIYEQYQFKSMTIFLYQTFVFFILYRVGNHLFPLNHVWVNIILPILYTVLAIPLCAVPAFVFGWIENFKAPPRGSRRSAG